MFVNIVCRCLLPVVPASRDPPAAARVFPSTPAAAQNAGLHRPDAALQHLRHFFVAEPFQVPQHHRDSKNVRDQLQARFALPPEFRAWQVVRMAKRTDLRSPVCVPFLRLRVDGNIFLQVPFEPALVIQRFPNGDAIQPGFKRSCRGGIRESRGTLSGILPAWRRRRPIVTQHA